MKPELTTMARYISYTSPALCVYRQCLYSGEKPADPFRRRTRRSRWFSASRLARLDTGMSNWVKHKWINGSVALIARHGKVVFYKAYGYNDVDTKAPLPKDGIFRIASQTKAITTVAALMLWEEGKFSFDDPVSKYIPTFAHQTVLASFNPKDSSYTTVPARRQITIHDLFTHTSGTRVSRHRHPGGERHLCKK